MSDLSRTELVRKLAGLEPKLRADGVTSLALFGSRARGDNRPDSDIDLLIEVEPARKFSLIDLVRVAHDVEDETGLPANIFMKRSLDESFGREAHNEAVSVFQ